MLASITLAVAAFMAMAQSPSPRAVFGSLSNPVSASGSDAAPEARTAHAAGVGAQLSSLRYASNFAP